MIRITQSLAIDEAEVEEHFIRAPGPGGQKVNKTESAVQLRFDARHSPAVSATVYARLKPLAGRRLTKDGVLVITANRFRSQERNREDALERLIDLLRRATVAPKHRRPTRPSKAAKQRRLEGKRVRSGIKRGRGRVTRTDDD
jgi:ribosome-associated protein